MKDPLRHAMPVGLLVAIWAGLMGLLAATYVLAAVPLGSWNLVVSLGIGVIKAALVLWVFMELKDNTQLVNLFAGTGFYWLAILLVLGLADFLTRGWLR
jgi:cytochrome c oxidase subunit 4